MRFSVDTSEGNHQIFSDDKTVICPVSFETPTTDDVTLLPAISQDARFIKWASGFAGASSSFRLKGITFRDVERSSQRDHKQASAFSKLVFTITVEDTRATEKDKKIIEKDVILEEQNVAILFVFRVMETAPSTDTPSQTTQRSRDYVLFLRRPQATIGTDSYSHVPKGYIDDNRVFVGGDAVLLKDVAKLDTIRDYQLTNMTDESLRRAPPSSERPKGVSCAPEYLGGKYYLYLYRETISKEELQRLKDISSETTRSESIHLSTLRNAWFATTDSVSLSALLYFHELRYHGYMPLYLPPRQPQKPPVFTPVVDLDPNGGGYNLLVRVVDVQPVDSPSAPNTRASRKDYLVGDATGCVKFRLAHDQIAKHQDLLEAGTPIVLRNVILDMTGGCIALVVHAFSKMGKATADLGEESLNFEANVSNNVSEMEYENVAEVHEYDTRPPRYLDQRFRTRAGRGRRNRY